MGLKNFTALIVLLVGFAFFLQTLGIVTGVEKIWPAFLILWGLGVLFGEHGLHCICDNCCPPAPRKKNGKKK